MLQDNFDAVCNILEAKKTAYEKAIARCPAKDHEDRNPSLSLWVQNERVMFKCFSKGCSTEEITRGIEARTHPDQGRAKLNGPTQKEPFHSADSYLASKKLEKSFLSACNPQYLEEATQIAFPITRCGTQIGIHFIDYGKLNSHGSAEKRTKGQVKGGAVQFLGSNDLYICEGVITAATVSALTCGTVLASCGADNMINAPIPESEWAHITVVDPQQIRFEKSA